MAGLVAPETKESIWLAGGALASRRQGSHLFRQSGDLLFKGFYVVCVCPLLFNGS